MQAWKDKLPWLFWHGSFCKFIKVLEKYHLRVIWFAVVAPNDHVRTFKIAWVHAYLCVIKNAFVLCSLKFMGHLCLLYRIWVLIFSYLFTKLSTELAINAKNSFTRKFFIVKKTENDRFTHRIRLGKQLFFKHLFEDFNFQIQHFLKLCQFFVSSVGRSFLIRGQS